VRVLVVLGVLARVATAEPTYAPAARVAHLRAALDGLAKLGADSRHALEVELHDAVRTKCRAATTRASTSCLIEVGQAVCGAKPQQTMCLAVADVMLTNQHAETDLLDDATRMKLVRGSTDYHAAVNLALRAIYALLAAELALGPQAGDDATRIDAFCAGRDATVHACEPGAKACVASMAYQRCAAGLVWYLGDQEMR